MPHAPSFFFYCFCFVLLLLMAPYSISLFSLVASKLFLKLIIIVVRWIVATTTTTMQRVWVKLLLLMTRTESLLWPYYSRRNEIATQQHLRLQSIQSRIDYYQSNFVLTRAPSFMLRKSSALPPLSKIKRVKRRFLLPTNSGGINDNDCKPAAKKRNRTHNRRKTSITTSVDFFNSSSDKSHGGFVYQ